MTQHYQKVLTLEALEAAGSDVLYEFDEIQQALYQSKSKDSLLCFFLFDLDFEICIASVKDVVQPPIGKDSREAEVVMHDDRVLKLYEVMAVCHYQNSDN